MSYDKEIAERHLEFGELDEIILNEREQKHILMDGEYGNLHAMPSTEYVELRDKYIEAVKEIKAFDPAAKIIMCSAMGQQSMVMDAIRAGARDFIVKPFQADRVLEAIKKVVG